MKKKHTRKWLPVMLAAGLFLQQVMAVSAAGVKEEPEGLPQESRLAAETVPGGSTEESSLAKETEREESSIDPETSLEEETIVEESTTEEETTAKEETVEEETTKEEKTTAAVETTTGKETTAAVETTPEESDTETETTLEEETTSEEETAAETEDVFARYGDASRLVYSTHVQTFGWQDPVPEGSLSGTVDKSKRLEGIKIWLNNPKGIDGSIQYRTHVQTFGWQDWVGNGELSGTVNKSKRLEAIEIRLTGQMAETYDIYYRVHSQTFGWLDWAKNGEVAGTSGYSKRLEAIEIVLVDKGGKAPGPTEDPFLEHILLKYTTHVQTFGWQDWVVNGAMSGTSGKSKRLEGIKIVLDNLTHTQGGIRYRTHVQTFGWQDWVENGALSGTTGKSKRLEAIEIELTGEMATVYDVYYRTHVQTFGWTGWAKNGEACGSTEYSKRLEGIEIRLVKKGKNVPGSTENILFTPMRSVKWGIDVSNYQRGTNWKRAKEDGVEFAMFRLTQKDEAGREIDGTKIYIQKDKSLDDNLMGTAANGIPIGGYVYNYASTPEEARAEARYAVSLLKGYKVTYPIAFDLERKEHMNTASKLNNMAMAKAFCEEIRAAGYIPAVYGSPNKLRTCFDYTELASLYDIWLARYRWSDTVMDFSDLATKQQVYATGYEGGNYTNLSRVTMWQFTERGQVAGVPGYCDLDILYKEY
ncbi:MAG: hypothetical protein HFI63_04715 [Lachnospiraceae bacterium]|nr:hypothetical protein [Lachnospiraceae bacterium]